jgi:hypothetical protein
MKKIFILLLLISSNSFSQETCTDSIFYLKPLNKLLNFTNNRSVIEFNYKMSESLQESIFDSSLFNEEEKLIVKDALLNKYDYSPCGKVLEIVLKLKKRPLGERNTFMNWKYSKPIFVSDNKAYLFYEILLKRENYSSITSGSSKVQVFERYEGVWKLTNRKTLEYY